MVACLISQSCFIIEINKKVYSAIIIFFISLYRFSRKMLPPQAEKKMQLWIRSRHLICAGNFFVFETVERSTVDRFDECVQCLGGAVISVTTIKTIEIGHHRKVLVYQARASLHTPHHNLRQYWLKYGGFYTRFDERG